MQCSETRVIKERLLVKVKEVITVCGHVRSTQSRKHRAMCKSAQHTGVLILVSKYFMKKGSITVLRQFQSNVTNRQEPERSAISHLHIHTWQMLSWMACTIGPNKTIMIVLRV